MKPTPDETVSAIKAAIRRQPDAPYIEIARQVGVSKATVNRIGASMGIRRMSEERIMRMESRPLPGKPRVGGIFANDALWRARQERIR